MICKLVFVYFCANNKQTNIRKTMKKVCKTLACFFARNTRKWTAIWSAFAIAFIIIALIIKGEDSWAKLLGIFSLCMLALPGVLERTHNRSLV